MMKGYRVGRGGGLFAQYVCHCIFVFYNMSVSVLVYVHSFCNKNILGLAVFNDSSFSGSIVVFILNHLLSTFKSSLTHLNSSGKE